MPPPAAPGLALRAPGPAPGWLRLASPLSLLVARRPAEVVPLLREVESATERGLMAAGFIAYEAAPAFDAALRTRPAGRLPLAWFALFPPTQATPDELAGEPLARGPYTLSPWRPGLSAGDYRRAVDQVRGWIATGDTYQVNLTLRLRARFGGDPWSLFAALWRAQRAGASAYVDTGDWILCSASPELFFALEGDHIVARPMKGTAPRGRTVLEDDRRAAELQRSVKNRAENVMVVDMLRNDLGRVATPGTVRVPRLFELEKYDSLYQLTSTVEAQTRASLSELFAALFPCASITGAPKVRTMELITALEEEPRGVYTGAIGVAGPGRRATFSVAIRTVQIERSTGEALYGTGGGIVWDSSAEEEYQECRTKALVLTSPRPELSLLETLRWEPGRGYALLDRHLERLADSARYFDLPCEPTALRARLEAWSAGLPQRAQRIRLVLAPDGRVALEHHDLGRRPSPLRVALALAPVDRADRLLFHKTTRRETYDSARRSLPRHDDVLLWNRERELTESTVANLVLQIGGELWTPPLDCGLLGGTLRAELLAAGRVRERVLPLDSLHEAEAIYLVSSVRGWARAELDQQPLAERSRRSPSP